MCSPLQNVLGCGERPAHAFQPMCSNAVISGITSMVWGKGSRAQGTGQTRSCQETLCARVSIKPSLLQARKCLVGPSDVLQAKAAKPQVWETCPPCREPGGNKGRKGTTGGHGGDLDLVDRRLARELKTLGFGCETRVRVRGF
jgi:hypothetical protein